MNHGDLIYLDNNATTRVHPAVVEAMMPYWTDSYFNPSSVAGGLHGAASPILKAKAALASSLGGAPDEFILTSGATEANNWVLQATVARAIREGGRCHIIVSAIEHPSVLETAQILAQSRAEIRLDLIPVGKDGVIELEALGELVTAETSLVSVMLANNETGVIQPVGEAARLIKERSPRCLFHTDATQAVGKISFSLDDDLLSVDFLSLSAHKFHGPKGVGALFVRSGSPLDAWMLGGSQQDGRRAGTENPAASIGLAEAITVVGSSEEMARRSDEVRRLRDGLEGLIHASISEIKFLGSGAARLPNTTLLLLPEMEGEEIVHQLLEQGIVTSTGSACSSGSDRPSHVVTAMGVPFSSARNVLRFSLSSFATAAEVQSSGRMLVEILSRVPHPK
jgi:cysteine desulfurase